MASGPHLSSDRHIFDLSLPLIQDIFGHLDARDLCMLSCVCTSFNHLANDAYFWKKHYCNRWSPPTKLCTSSNPLNSRRCSKSDSSLNYFSSSSFHHEAGGIDAGRFLQFSRSSKDIQLTQSADKTSYTEPRSLSMHNWRKLYANREIKSRSLLGKYVKDSLFSNDLWIRCVKIIPFTDLAVSVGDSVVRIWDLSKCILLASSACLRTTLRAIATDGTHLAVAGSDAKIRVLKRSKKCAHIFNVSGAWSATKSYSRLHNSIFHSTFCSTPDFGTLQRVPIMRGSHGRRPEGCRGRKASEQHGERKWKESEVCEGSDEDEDDDDDDGEEASWLAHTGPISCLSLEGNNLFSGSWDTEVKLWDIREDGELQRTFSHSDWLRGLAARSDRLYTCTDLLQSSWDTETGKILRTRKINSALGHFASVEGDRCGRYVFVGTESGKVLMFDERIRASRRGVGLSGAFSGDLVCNNSSQDGCYNENGLLSSDLVAVWHASDHAVMSLSFDYPWVVSGASDGVCSLVNIEKFVNPKIVNEHGKKSLAKACNKTKANRIRNQAFHGDKQSVSVSAQQSVSESRPSCRMVHPHDEVMEGYDRHCGFSAKQISVSSGNHMTEASFGVGVDPPWELANTEIFQAKLSLESGHVLDSGVTNASDLQANNSLATKECVIGEGRDITDKSEVSECSKNNGYGLRYLGESICEDIVLKTDCNGLSLREFEVAVDRRLGNPGFGINTVDIHGDKIICGGEKGKVFVFDFSKGSESEERARSMRRLKLERRMTRKLAVSK